MSPRTGRPKSENPLLYCMKVRLDKETYEKMERYCEKHNITKTELARSSVQRVLDEDEIKKE